MQKREWLCSLYIFVCNHYTKKLTGCIIILVWYLASEVSREKKEEWQSTNCG